MNLLTVVSVCTKIIVKSFNLFRRLLGKQEIQVDILKVLLLKVKNKKGLFGSADSFPLYWLITNHTTPVTSFSCIVQTFNC